MISRGSNPCSLVLKESQDDWIQYRSLHRLPALVEPEQVLDCECQKTVAYSKVGVEHRFEVEYRREQVPFVREVGEMVGADLEQRCETSNLGGTVLTEVNYSCPAPHILKAWADDSLHLCEDALVRLVDSH